MRASELPTISIAARGSAVVGNAALRSTFAGETPERRGHGTRGQSTSRVIAGRHAGMADTSGTGRHNALQPLAVTVARQSLRPDGLPAWPDTRQRRDWRRRLSKRNAVRFELLDSTDFPGGRNGSH